MADLVVQGDDLTVRLSALEKAESIHGDITVPLSSVRSVEVLDDPIRSVHGFRVGTGVPGLLLVGTVTSADGRVFAVIHHSDRRAVRVWLVDAPFDAWVVGCEDAETVAGTLRSASGRR